MRQETRRTLLILANCIAVAAVLVVNLMANAIPIGGNTTQEISDSYTNLFTPAPLTFAIWGVIYLLLLLFTVYQLWILIARKQDTAEFLDALGLLFVASCAATSASSTRGTTTWWSWRCCLRRRCSGCFWRCIYAFESVKKARRKEKP